MKDYNMEEKKDIIEFLVEYEMPKIAENISNNYLQNLLAKYTVAKVNKKLKRLKKIEARKEFLKKQGLI